MKNIYIVTGGPGFGKTSIIQALREQGFNGSDELSRQFIKEQVDSEGRLLPWIDRLGYSKEILKRRIHQYKSIPSDELWFFDRGIPDLIAYIHKDSLQTPEVYFKSAKEFRYNKIVFLTPPWQEIHKNDSERLELFEEAEAIHQEIENTYTSLGYKCITVPKTTLSERVKFILKAID